MRRLFAGVIAAVLALPAAAQNTSGVSGPTVRAGERSAEYRFAFTPGEDGRADRLAHRIQAAFSLDDRRRIRTVLKGRDRGGAEGFDFQYLQAELLWELSPEEATDWRTALRFDARLTGENRPDQVALNWTNQFRLSDRLVARAIAIGTVELGDAASDGVLLAARGALYYELAERHRLGIESFNNLGSTSDFGLEAQSRQLGPVLSIDATEDWSWSARTLFGLNEVSPDVDFRLTLERAF